MQARRKGWIAAAALAVLMASGGVLAHGGAEGVVKERMDLMEALGESMKVLKGQIMSGGEPDRTTIVREAAAIAGHAEVMTAKFPDGSLEGPTEARPEIWTRWADFEAAAEDLATAARQLETAAEAGDDPALQASFAGLAKSCGACHRAFRAKK